MNAAFATAAASALRPGRAAPLGAHAIGGGTDAAGVHFAVFSQRAKRVELCLFDADGQRELQRLPLMPTEDGVHAGFLPGAAPGLIYGYRAHGRYEPASGYRFNPHKLLLDPYAREIVGRYARRPEHYGHVHGHPEGARTMDTRDNAAYALKARVTAPDAPAARAPTQPRRALADLVLYELHVKGFTMTLPGVPDALRGTYAGLAHPAAIAHLRRLGVNALSLLPVHTALDEPALAERGLSNYWGYNTLGFFCPDARFAADRSPGGTIAEFKAMVATLQAEGFEVILDVVYNHTAEGDEHGPTLSFRGLDNASWYRLMPDDRSRYDNASGCGNTLRLIHPRTTQFVLDSLRYWVEIMGVDGFRFDLAPALGRTRHGFDPTAPFWIALRQDPTLSQVHLIAEPWDCGHDGYQLGRLPGRFLEWNDRFRDAVRGYWLGADAGAQVGRSEFARRFTASSDVFHHGHRLPAASVNFVAAHDGRTLADVVCYREKHNLANGEHNRDGHSHEVCANFGSEGPSDHPQLVETRRRVRRALLATALLAQGTPMLCAGDEFGNSQRGNNNAYCQDNPTGWLDWTNVGRDDDIDFVAAVLALRREDPLLRHARWFPLQPEAHEPALHWLRPDGEPMRVEDWHDAQAHAFACQLAETATAAPRWCIAFNPGAQAARFRSPHGPWRLALDSSGSLGDTGSTHLAQGDDGACEDGILQIPARALLVLRREQNSQETSR
ncbi:MAG: glycogen debranching protein GlgX [Pseudomonadota bacterium]